MMHSDRKYDMTIATVVIQAIVILPVILLLPLGAFSLPPHRINKSDKAMSEENYDLTTFLDANKIFSFVTNSGTIAQDHTNYFNRSAGLYYPFTGDTSLLRLSSYNRTLIYSAGLLLAGKVEGELRTAVAVYDQPEYTAGSIDGGVGGESVYKIDTSSGPGDYAYDNWPDDLGAPVDDSGFPLLIGKQTLWAIFNDNNSDNHSNYYGGGTLPLGIEVHQLIWADDIGEEDNNVFHLRYKLYNKGSNIIDSFYITFFADPDLGGPNDDLIGCDTTHDLFFAYNGTDADVYFGDLIPAWGGQVIAGPVVPSEGSTAIFAGEEIPDYKNLGMTAFTRFVNGTEPNHPTELFDYMKGLNGHTGEPYVDPILGDTTSYYAPGDAVSRTGWVDTEAMDQRMMISFGPLTFTPGDSQQVELKIGAFVEEDRLFSLSRLRNILDSDIPIDTIPDTIKYLAADSIQATVNDYGYLRDVQYFPIKTPWLTGIDWGGDYFYGGIDYAEYFFGSALDPATMPDSFSAVEIRFSNVRTQRAYRYVRDLNGDYSYGGYHEVPFTVWNLDTDRQLNAAFVEWIGTDVVDFTWGPDGIVDLGGREFLTIFKSEYSGDNETDADVFYDTVQIVDQADSIDAMYFAWTALCCGRDLSAIDDEGTLVFDGQFMNPNGQPDSLRFQPVEVGGYSSQAIDLEVFAENPSQLVLVTSDPDAFRVSSSSLKYVNLTQQRVGINFYPYREGYFDEMLYVHDWVDGTLLKAIRLVSKTALPTSTPDDPGDQPSLPSGFILAQNYPNPFNPTTTISFSIPRKARVSLDVYNILGRKIATIVDKEYPAGNHSSVWDGTTDDGRAVSSGVYFYRLKTDNYVASKKMVLLK